MTGAGPRAERVRVGSALWWYLAAVTTVATATLAVGIGGLHAHDIAVLARDPAIWLVVGPLVVTGVQPVVPVARASGEVFAICVFGFALLLHVGLPVAAVCCVFTMALKGALSRQVFHRALFNAAQHALTLTASWGVLRAFGIDPTPAHPWSFTEPNIRLVEIVAGGLAALAYIVVNNGSVYVAIALSEKRSILRVVREDQRHLLFVCFAMVSLSPLVLVVMVHTWPLLPLFYPALIVLYHNASLSVAHEHDALHDPLTGLGNRELLHREATARLGDLTRRGDGVAVMVLDVDKFKRVNDTLGHAAGDKLLQVVAERLRAAIRPGDVVARLGGDEFVVLVRDVANRALARVTAMRLLDRVNGPFEVHGRTIVLAASLGVALAPRDGTEIAALLRRADHAMYIAKDSGCGVAVFDSVRDRDRRDFVTLEVDTEEGVTSR